MKKEKITIRVEENLKENFQKLCNQENVDMSDKLRKFVYDEVETKFVDYKKSVENMLVALGFKNVFIIESPMINLNNINYMAQTFKLKESFTLTDFFKEYEDKKIFLYLLGSDSINEVRVVLI